MASDDRDEAEILAANEAFYAAFATGDYLAMEGLWAEDLPVSCIHPGWPPVRGREKVMQTWKGILAKPPRPPISAMEATATKAGDAWLVTCFEAIGELYLSASNLFVREGGLWRLVHHQSGESAQAPKIMQNQSSKAIH